MTEPMTDTDRLATYPSLAGLSVLVTGGATGIGEEMVHGFVRNGAKVAFIDMNAVAGDALAAASGARFHACDLRDIKSTQAAVAKVGEEQGEVQVLVNNAAHDERHRWEEVTEEFWNDRQAVNLRHVFFVTQAVAPSMVRANAGSIVNLGSSSWMLAQGGMPGYTSAKAAIHGMTRSFARDLGKHNIRVNTIVPGWVLTQRQREKWLTPESRAKMFEDMCLADELMPVDIANMTLWLAAADSRMCTAQNFIVDGGWV